MTLEQKARLVTGTGMYFDMPEAIRQKLPDGLNGKIDSDFGFSRRSNLKLEGRTRKTHLESRKLFKRNQEKDTFILEKELEVESVSAALQPSQKIKRFSRIDKL